MQIAIGSDHGGFKLKKAIIAFLQKKNKDIKDFGTYSEESCDYPQFAYAVARYVAEKPAGRRGILICKSGIGNSIVANKVRGVRAALCHNVLAARLSRQHNDANVLVIGARFNNTKTVQRMVTTWLATEFEGGRHLRRIKQIERIERNV